MGEWIDGYMQRLSRVRERNLIGGGRERLDLVHQLGKLTARERIAHILDQGSFEEIGSIVTDERPSPDGRKRPDPSDGVVMGFGEIEGRPVALWVMDFTVMSGSLGGQTAWKMADITAMAGERGIPLIGVIDSAGERLGFKGGDSGMNGLGRLLRNYVLYSGVVPRITMLLGPCTGVLSVLPVLSDFLIIDRSSGFLWLGGDLSSDDAGDAAFHMEKSGQCDIIADGDADAVGKMKRLLRYLPQNCWEGPSFHETGDDPLRREETLMDVMPDNPKFTYDMHEMIDKIVDDGEFFEIKEDYATHLITGFCRFGGRVAGVVANNPDELSGILEPDSSDKYDRFMRFLDAFNIPLVTLVDTTAFPPGDRWERLGIIRHGAKLLHSYAHLTCPKVTMVLRRSYGGANIVLGCSKMFPDYVYAWPTVEFAPTGPETVVHAVFHKELAKAKEEGNYDEVYNFLLGILKEGFSVMNLAKDWTTYYTAHEVIDPRDTRSRIVKAIALLQNKRETLPEKKRSIKPA
jgi:acetyl-CoA carboxylase carboxyltransferase component